jgi:hypothetical protein
LGVKPVKTAIFKGIRVKKKNLKGFYLEMGEIQKIFKKE